MTKNTKKYYPTSYNMMLAGEEKLEKIIKCSEDPKEVEIAKKALENIKKGVFFKMY